MEKLWTISEAAQYLGVTESDVEALVDSGKLTGYRLGGQFVRFRPEQVKLLKDQIPPRSVDALAVPQATDGWRDKLRDVVYFYDFYLLSFLLCAGLVVYLIWSG